MRYIDTNPNKDQLRKCIEKVPYILTELVTPAVPIEGDNQGQPQVVRQETYINTTPENKKLIDVEAEAIHMILNELEITSILLWMHDIVLKKCGMPLKDCNMAQRGKKMQKSLAPKHFKNIYRPTNNNLRTSSNTRNKKMNTSPRTGYDRQTGQFGNQMTVIVSENRETIGNQVDTDEEPDEQELEAHYMYMANIQESLHAVDDNPGPTYDAEPLENVHIDDDYNVFANETQHSEQPKFINDTYLVEKADRNVTPDSSNTCDNEGKAYQNVDEPKNERKADQNVDEPKNERVVLASLIDNLKLDVDENKMKHKQLKKANTSLSQELEKSKQDLFYCKNELDKKDDMPTVR
nr:hypothetical protein [Tanacetum cinerariifolium]